MASRALMVTVVAIFLLMIGSPLVMLPSSPKAEWQAAHLPGLDDPLSVKAIKVFELPAAYSAYFSSHYFLHQKQVELFNFLRLRAAGDSVFPNVVIGKQDWLYFTGENNIRDYECTFMFNADEISTIEENLREWDRQLREQGIQFYVVIVPNKETIYPHYLPETVQPALGICRIDQVVEMLVSTDLTFLDLRSALRDAAQEEQVYHRTDTHWNDSGALIATAEILQLIRRDFPQVGIPALADYTEDVQWFRGDLAAFLPLDDRFMEQALMLEPADGTRARYLQGEDRRITTLIAGSDLPRAVIFRDSFSDALIPFLAENFSEAAFVHSFQVDFGLVEDVRPDIVILEVAQRYLVNLR